MTAFVAVEASDGNWPDLGVRKCVWAQCGRVSTELVETGSGVVFACCHDHAEIERNETACREWITAVADEHIAAKTEAAEQAARAEYEKLKERFG